MVQLPVHLVIHLKKSGVHPTKHGSQACFLLPMFFAAQNIPSRVPTAKEIDARSHWDETPCFAWAALSYIYIYILFDIIMCVSYVLRGI